MKKNFKLEVYIGNCFPYNDKEAIACVSFPPGESVFIPDFGVKKFKYINTLANHVADFYHFYNEYIDKNSCPKFVVEIHLNVQSNKKVFYGYDAIKVIDRIATHYNSELREF